MDGDSSQNEMECGLVRSCSDVGRVTHNSLFPHRHLPAKLMPKKYTPIDNEMTLT
jgi:hypothetical protein